MFWTAVYLYMFVTQHLTENRFRRIFSALQLESLLGMLFFLKIKTTTRSKMPNGDRAPWRPLFENFKIQTFQFQKILKINTHIPRYIMYMCANFQVEIH